MSLHNQHVHAELRVVPEVGVCGTAVVVAKPIPEWWDCRLDYVVGTVLVILALLCAVAGAMIGRRWPKEIHQTD